MTTGTSCDQANKLGVLNAHRRRFYGRFPHMRHDFSWLRRDFGRSGLLAGAVAALFLLMLGMGATLSRADFNRVVQRPAPVLIGLASQYGRYGYRRITALLQQEGWHVNHKRVERIWRQEGLKAPQKQTHFAPDLFS